MRLPFTRKILIDWAGQQVVNDADAMVERGAVLQAEFDDPTIKGAIRWNNRELNTSLTIMSGAMVDNHCPCYANQERGVVCAHVISLALTLLKRATDPRREAKYQEELRRASRIAAISESDYIQRVSADTDGAKPCSLELSFDEDWKQTALGEPLSLLCHVTSSGHTFTAEDAPRDVPFTFSRIDEALLYVLEDICEGPISDRIELKLADLANVFQVAPGKQIGLPDGSSLVISQTPMSTRIRIDLDHENGELILIAHTEVPFTKAGEFPHHLVTDSAGWVAGDGQVWPLENLLPLPYHGIYAEPIILKRQDVMRFLKQELPLLRQYAPIESEVTEDLLTIEAAQPRFHLTVRGSAASLSATLQADYGDVVLTAGKKDAREHFAIPDEEDLLRYTVRNPAAEQQALDDIGALGMAGEHGEALDSIVGRREVLNFLGSGFPALRRRGWRVDLEGRVAPLMDDMESATPVVHIHEGSDNGWFEVGLDIEASDGASLSQAEVQRALLKGENFVEHNGRTLLLDADAIRGMQDVFEDCASGEASQPGCFRLSNLHAGFVQSSLDTLDGVDVEDLPAWRQRAAQGNRASTVEPVKISSEVKATLRPYQQEGVNWLRFLEKNNFSGILADEMGLGKTLQTLVWLDLKRNTPEAQGRPALIVCPTSIVENWEAEAKQFTPHRSVLLLSGPDRHKKWDDVPNSDIIVTSYALIRRDLERFLDMEFAAIVLDEAQHIKNHSTQNAKAAKQLRSIHKLVLSGTPVENSVSDLWSIMDFLMPGYLGNNQAFRERYEKPIERGGEDAQQAQKKLRRKMQPFMLRRLKRDVAKDLPPKIQKVELFSLSPDQRLVYTNLVKTSRQRLADLVATQGFHRSRFEVLKTLMQLRQVCCHLDLLKLPDLKPKAPSAKMELFFELLSQAIDGGHRVLVFSQFVGMLKILRKELESQKINYCYLDGSTKERLKVVQEFNTQRHIPVFLISLKAGGTGLNLTGADMVIHFDPWWNPAVENQATDRAYRIGQKRTVYSVKLIARDTVEEKVLELQRKKQIVIDSIVESDEAVVESLNWEQVQSLLDA